MSEPDSKYQIPKLQLKNKQRTAKILKLVECLKLDHERTQKVADTFVRELEEALAERPSSLQMENTYIPQLPDGTEQGIFLALDLGGTNFRVILLELDEGNVIREHVKPYHIPDNLRIGCGEELFDFLAKCLVDFVVEENLEQITIPLGFTFSFPMRQHSLQSASLVTWTKSFNCPSVVGQDVVRLLNESLQRCGHNHINVVAILNDTTGTLMQGAHLDNRTRIGIVIGTGSNACYVERADRVQHWETGRHGEQNVIIDVEWGAFGYNGVLDFIKTPYDIEVDNGSLLVNSFTFEKYIAGKYLGEIVRVVLKDLRDHKLLFIDAPAILFPQPWAFGTNMVSQIEEDSIEESTKLTERILSGFGYKVKIGYTKDDIKIIQYVAALVSYRAAKLVSINTAVLLNRMQTPAGLDPDDELSEIVVAIDGSLYKLHPRMKGWLERQISGLIPGKRFSLMLAEDGSGKGAGLVAAIALKLKSVTSL